MRILSLVLSLVVTLALATVALIYLERQVGQQRIYVQDEWLTSAEEQAYRTYGEPASVTLRDTVSFPRR